jgi:amidase
LSELHAFELAALARAGERSADEIARELIGTLEGDRSNAWQAFEPEGLLAQARALDRRSASEREQLALFAVPVGVKDAFDTLDLPTTYGSPIYAGHRPERDAALVARLRGAGALIAGKTKCTEFSWMTATDTANPLAPGRTPGGSSSGSAAAVAAGQVPLATATQTAGSTIRPGSYCGLLAFKPTFGLLPREGIYALAASLDTVGLIARDVRDLRLAAGIATAEQPPAQLRIAFVATPWWDELEPEARVAIEDSLSALRARGVVLEPLELPELGALVSAQLTIQLAESALSLRGELAAHEELLSGALRAALAEGAAISRDAYESARATRAAHAGPLERRLAGYHAVLTPSAHGAPPVGLEQTGDPLYCRAWTLVGMPCISIPLAWTGERLPVGLQLTAPRGADARLLAVAQALLELVRQ